MPRPLLGAARLTPAERQARRRERFRETMAENDRLREALRLIIEDTEEAGTRAVARAALAE